MKRIALGMICLLMPMLLFAQATQYEAPAFTANFPSGGEVKYQRSTSTAKDGTSMVNNSYAASYDNDGAALFITYIDYATARAATVENEDRIIDGGISNVFDTTTVNATRSNSHIGNVSARAAAVTGKSKDGRFNWVAFIRCGIQGTRVWMAFVIEQQNADGTVRFDENTSNGFLNSINIR
jgi:hypothetical protein